MANLKNLFSGGVSYGAQAANPKAAPTEVLEPQKIMLNRQNRRRRRHDANRLGQQILQRSKTERLRNFWREMFA